MADMADRGLDSITGHGVPVQGGRFLTWTTLFAAYFESIFFA